MDKYYFFESYYNALKDLKTCTRYAIREAIDEYMFEGIEPDLKDPLQKSIWSLLLPTLRKSKIKYANAKGKKQANQEQNREQNESEMQANVNQNKNPLPVRPSISISISKEDKENKEDGKRNKENNIPPKSPKGYGEDFEKFWKEYPRHDAKQDAFKSFSKVIKDTTLDTLLNSIKSFKETESWQRDDGKYIPYASTWLNGKRWLDDQGTEEEKPKPIIPELAECPVCKSSDLIHSLGRYKCNSCKLMWEWNCEDKRWETTL